MDKELDGRLLSIEAAINVLLAAIEPEPLYAVNLMMKVARSKMIDASLDDDSGVYAEAIRHFDDVFYRAPDQSDPK
jgi:hypothetical protein